MKTNNTKPFSVTLECVEDNGDRTVLQRQFNSENEFQDCIAELMSEYREVRQLKDSRDN